MRIVIKPLGIVTLMVLLATLVSITIYSIGPRQSRSSGDSTDDFGKPFTPVPVSTPSPSATVAEPADLLTADPNAWTLELQAPGKATRAIISDLSTPNAQKHYLRAVITKIDPNRFWIVQCTQLVNFDVPEGQALVARLVARSPTRNPVDITFLRNGADHHSGLGAPVTLTSEWKTYSFPFTASRTYLHASADGAADVCLHIGRQLDTVDLALLQISVAAPPAAK